MTPALIAYWLVCVALAVEKARERADQLINAADAMDLRIARALA